MKRILFLFLPLILFSEDIIVSSDNYKITEDRDRSYIYSSEYEKILPAIKEYQGDIIRQYEDEYGFKLDDRLRVGLASQNNQVANAFSTQVPFNSQLLYGAGAGNIDYFCFSSWLKTIIIHETAHNFQLNPKENIASKVSHNILGNTFISNILFYPLFPIPNFMINSFLIEGNAVLNESRFGNGGRLYSGYALAEVVAMARDGKILPELMYNNTLNFPYGEKSYLIGGFFQKFLFEKYGAKKVNQYFKEKSKQPIPIFTDRAFKYHFGKSFDTLLAEFVEDINREYKNYRETHGNILAKSQLFVPLNRNDNEIYTLIGDYKSYPKIFSIDKGTKHIRFIDGAFRVGEPFKIDGEYYTTSSVKTSPTKKEIGLIDNRAYIRDGSEGKAVQGFLKNGDMVYFDIEKSLEAPHIYINGKFYDISNSTLFVDGDDLYYFKQRDSKRTLYKNRKPLFSYIGHYGFVADVDRDEVYFIALSRYGSTLYSFRKGEIRRVVDSDDIIEFKKIDKSSGLVVTIGSDGYSYQIVDLKPKIGEVFNTKYIEDREFNLFSYSDTKLSGEDYTPMKELEYSSLVQNMKYRDYEGLFLDVKAEFSDPLMQNSLDILFSGNKQRFLGGLSYENSAYMVEFGGDILGVSHNKKYDSSDEDDFGYSAYLKFPFLAKGYYRASTKLNYTDRYNSIREPLTLSLDISNIKKFGISKYPNHKNILNAFILEDRDNSGYGLSYSWLYGLGWDSYIGFNGEYLKSSKVDFIEEKGVEINDQRDSFQDDKLRVSIPTLKHTLYAKEAKISEFSIYKSIDTPLYFYSFPLSLQRENLYIKQKFYDIDFFNRSKKYSETTFGLESDFLFFNNFAIPIVFEYIYNRDTADNSIFRAFLGIDF